MQRVECYGVFEVTIAIKETGNPFKDHELFGLFVGEHEKKRVRGFYDGEGIFKIRFMPSFQGEYHYMLQANFQLETSEGSFVVQTAQIDNHGPVRVANQFHFAYEDGIRYFPVGTTCYAWHLQSEEMQEQTLKTLKESGFNKLRFCVLPKHYRYNLQEPKTYPYERKDNAQWKPEDFAEDNLEEKPRNPLGGIQVMIEEPDTVWDYERFNPKYFQHIEKCIEKLMKLGIEADIILLHPYDRWGYSIMGEENENFLLQYMIARFAAFRNVWWSLANEYDLFREKPIRQWEENAKVLLREDPYGHLRSIHNCMRLYDYTRAWITHCSIQRTDLYKTAENTAEWRTRFGKPIVLDEIAYEGNIAYGWGNISGEEMVRRFWEAYTRGGYATHGETYTHPENILWWSHGGILHGSSPKRIAFLRKIMEEAPGNGMEPTETLFDETIVTEKGSVGVAKCYVYYFGANRPSEREFRLPDTQQYRAQIIDTWNMEIQDVGCVKGNFTLTLPGRGYIAVRFMAVE